MKSFLTILSIFILTNILAQEKWDFDKSLTYALQHNTEILSIKLNKDIETDNLKLSKKAFLPQLQINANQSFQLGNTYNISTGVGQKESSYTGFNLSASTVLFNGLLKHYEYKYEKNQVLKSRFKIKEKLWEIIQQFTTFYLQLLYDNENLTRITEQIKQQKLLIEKIKKLTNKKLKDPDYLLKEQITLYNLIQEKQLTGKKIKVDKLNLLKLMNLNNKNIDFEPVNENDFEIIKNEIAIDNHPSLLIKKQEIKLLELKRKIEKSKQLPKLSLNYTFGSYYYHILGSNDLIFNQQTQSYENYGFAKQFDANKKHYIGFALSIPVFNIHNTKLQLKKIEKQKQITELNYQNTYNEIDRLYNKLLLEIATAQTTHQIDKNNYEIQRKLYAKARKKYLQNMISYNEWQTTQTKFQTITAKMLQSKYNYLLQVRLLKEFDNITK